MKQNFVEEILRFKEDPNKRKALVTQLFHSSDFSSLEKATLVINTIEAILFDPPTNWIACDIKAEQEENYIWYFLAKMNQDDEALLNEEVVLNKILSEVDPVLFSLKIFDLAYEYNMPMTSENFN